MQKIKFNISKSILSLLKKKSKSKAFTLAEILLSLTIIGIVAAIALPSLLGNANERAWETQKKAIYTRFSQALPLLPSLNGYGELVGNLPSCTENCLENDQLKDTAAESFIRDGLSKVMKITNICDSEHLGDCGLPDKIIPVNNGTAIALSSIKTLGEFNPKFAEKITATWTTSTYEQINTKAAAFETVNGESVLVYYNPYCTQNLNINEGVVIWSQALLCANFVYDLNGKKGPNTVGKDIGFISALYSTSSEVVAPIPYHERLKSVIQPTAVEECNDLGDDMKLPNIDDLTSLFYNMKLLGIENGGYWSGQFHSKRANGDVYAWYQNFNYGHRHGYNVTTVGGVLCVKRR